MGQPDDGKMMPGKQSIDWERALELYEQVMASSQSEVVRVKATIKLARLCKEAPEDILARAIPVLAKLLENHPSENSNALSIQEAAAYCLKCISGLADGRFVTEIGRSGALHSLLRLLQPSDGSFREVVIHCIWSVVTFGSVNREIVARNGGVEIVIDMLKICISGSRGYLLEILSALALLREVRRVLANLGGLPFLVEAARTGSKVSRERACQAIGLLGNTRRARRTIVEFGAIPILVDLFQGGDGATKLIAANALGVISSHIDHIRPLAEAGAIPLYAELLQGPEASGKEIAEDVFCILAVAEPNAVAIAEHLVRILREGDDEAKAAAADVLWDLAGYKHSVSIVRNAGAIPILVELLQTGNSEVKEKVSAAISQLSYNEVERVALADAGAIPVLIELLQDEMEELRDNAAEALINFSEDCLQRDMIAEAIDSHSLQNMQSRVAQIHAADELMERSLRQMSTEQLTWNTDL